MSNIDLILVTKDQEDSFQKLRYQKCSESESRMEVKWKPNGKENGKYSCSYFRLKLNYLFLIILEKKQICLHTVRNSRPDVFCKKGVLKNLAKFTGNQLC